LIGLITREHDISMLSNVIGSSYVDVYLIYISEFQIALKVMKIYLRDYFKDIGVEFFNDVRSQVSNSSIVDRVISKKYFSYSLIPQ
jgi:hypothetical protein